MVLQVGKAVVLKGDWGGGTLKLVNFYLICNMRGAKF